LKKKLLIVFSALVLLALVLTFTVFRKGNGQAAVYKTEDVKKGSIQALVDTTGTLNAVTMVEVGSQVSGKIRNIYVDYNSVVKAGQVIARIEPDQFETRVKQSEANYQSSLANVEKSRVNLENTERKMNRALQLAEKNLISFEEKEAAEVAYYEAKANLQQAQASLEQSKSSLESSRLDLSYTIIRSPIDGIVISREVNEGQTVAASMQAPVLFTIAQDLTKMQVECSVDEADIGKVAEGQQVQFTVDAFPNDRFRGEVKQVRYSPVVDSNVVTYITVVEVDNPELKLRPGMTATVSVVVGEARDKLLVPNSALRWQPELTPEEMRALFMEMRGRAPGGGQAPSAGQPPAGFTPGGGQGRSGRMRDVARVWTQDETGKLHMVFFKPGVTDNLYTEVAAGDIKEGTTVITGTGSTASNGSNNNARRMMRFMR
jgi:HlyD family secretion protein